LVTTFQGGSLGAAWDSNYAAVYHLPDGSTLNGNDSTVNAFNATNHNATAATGQIDGAANLASGSSGNQYLDSGAQSALDPAAAVTLEAWVKFNTNRDSAIVSKISSSSYNGYMIWYQGFSNSNQYAFYINGGERVTGGVLTPGNWYHIVAVWNGSTVSLYKNGVLDAGPSAWTTAPSSVGQHFLLGAYDALASSYGGMNGVLDEVRVSKTARTADWIATEYNNQVSPATFYSVGPPQ
jgi:hypothetical protein